jgi:Tfp pilus assembly protein PilO
MGRNYKLLLCIGLFVGALMLAYFDVYPAFVESQGKAEDLKQRQASNDVLVKQLQKKHLAEAEKTRLESDIQLLHGAVPKSPELDLLVLDLEKICNSCDLDLVGVENPEPEVLKQLHASEEQMQTLIKENGSKLTLGSHSLAKPDNKNSAAKKLDEGDKQPALKQLPKTVFVTGSYDNFVKLMRKLENYRRVIGVKNVSIAMAGQTTDIKAPAFDKANKLKVTQPMMSFLMIVYYLP